MGILKSDISRNFGIGFIVGVFMVGAMSVLAWDTEIAGPAMAATADAEASITR